MQFFLIPLIRTIAQVLSLAVLVNVILSYFLAPYHPIRATLDRVLEPMMAPIRRVVPPLGMLDFTPFVFLLLVQLIEFVLIQIIASL